MTPGNPNIKAFPSVPTGASSLSIIDSYIGEQDWRRVSRREPCRICGKPQWCTIHANGSACCMRVESERPMKNGGWLHKSENPVQVTANPRPRIQKPDKTIDWAALLAPWKALTTQTMKDALAASLGVSVAAIASIGAVWAPNHSAWAFPMKSAYGETIGIRLRNDAGKKWAVTGSKAGLFYGEIARGRTLWVCEGCTDILAAITMGMNAVGRHACRGQDDMVSTLCVKHHITRAVIIADSDGPGLDGAEALQMALPRLTTVLWSPPGVKDLREALAAGGDLQWAESQVNNFIWKAAKG